MRTIYSFAVAVCSGLLAFASANAQSFSDNFAPPYTNNWFLVGNAGIPPGNGGCDQDVCFTYTTDGLQWSADTSLTSDNLDSNTVFAGNIDVSFTYNHQGFGRTNVGLMSADSTTALAVAALDTDDTNYLNFIVPNCSDAACSTEYEHAGTPYMNRWTTIRIQVQGTNVMFYAGVDGQTPTLLDTLHLSSPLNSYRLYLDVHSAPWKSGGNTTTFRNVSTTILSTTVEGADVSFASIPTGWIDTVSQKYNTRCFIQSIWGGKSTPAVASMNLKTAATSNNAAIGAYALLDPDGSSSQITTALNAITSISPQPPIAFVAVDIEQDPKAIKVNNALNHVQLYADAIAAIWKNGFPAAVYTNKGNWDALTNRSAEIQPLPPAWDIPLWGAGGGNGSTNGDGTNIQSVSQYNQYQQFDTLSNFAPFGPWQSWLGKQYVLSPHGTENLLESVSCDLDVFDASILGLSRPPIGGAPALRITNPTLSRTPSGLTLSAFVSNDDPNAAHPISPALATRIIDIYIQPKSKGSKVQGLKDNGDGTSTQVDSKHPLQLNTVPDRATTPFTITFPFQKGGGLPATGSSAFVTLSLSCGGTRQTIQLPPIIVP
jgi:hypothetical protein